MHIARVHEEEGGCCSSPCGQDENSADYRTKVRAPENAARTKLVVCMQAANGAEVKEEAPEADAAAKAAPEEQVDANGTAEKPKKKKKDKADKKVCNADLYRI